MKNGSMPQRVLHEVSGRRIITRADLRHLSSGRYDQVGRALTRLVKSGHLEKIGRATWIRLDKKLPRLAHARLWSQPSGTSDDLALRATLVRPSFDDVAALCLTLGFEHVKATLADLRQRHEISERAAKRDDTIIANINAGLMRKGQPHVRTAS